MRRYYWTCPSCGANLDPNEKCEECQNEKKEPNGGQPTRLNQKRTVTVLLLGKNIKIVKE